MTIYGNNLRDNLFMTPRIKCPWCKAHSVSEGHGDNGWFIGCVNDDCKVNPHLLADGESEALRIWNDAEIVRGGE